MKKNKNKNTNTKAKPFDVILDLTQCHNSTDIINAVEKDLVEYNTLNQAVTNTVAKLEATPTKAKWYNRIIKTVKGWFK